MSVKVKGNGDIYIDAVKVSSTDTSGNITYDNDVTVSGAFTSKGIDDNATSTAITIDGSQNVGVNETTPLDKLHLAGVGTGGIRVEGTAPTIKFADTSEVDKNFQIRVDGQKLQVQTNNDAFGSASPVMTIDSSGNVGIGRTPTYKLDILETSATVARLNRGGTDGTVLEFANDGTTAGTIDVDGTGIVIDVKTGGINFGATIGGAITGNTLDDYEEGTWTPIFNNSATALGTYTKVGNLVTISAQVGTDAVGSAGQYLSGIPFTQISGSENFIKGVCTYQNDVSAQVWAVQGSASVDTFTFRNGADIKTLSASKTAYFTACYYV